MIKPIISKNGITKVIQLTDTHLFSNDEHEMYGVKSNKKFEAVINRLVAEDIHDAGMILLTGDISQDDSDVSYRKIATQLSRFDIPVFWIPGNHDDVKLAEVVFQDFMNFTRCREVSILGWKLVFVDTKLNGSESGYVSQDELDSLKKVITASHDINIAIVMHHHPIHVGTPLIDNYILTNREDFWSTADNINVKLVICGHVHGDYRIKHQNINIESSPATCLQWEKGTQVLQVDQSVGYKIYKFDSSGYKSSSKTWCIDEAF